MAAVEGGGVFLIHFRRARALIVTFACCSIVPYYKPVAPKPATIRFSGNHPLSRSFQLKFCGAVSKPTASLSLMLSDEYST